jgi:hypothetical protein
LEILEQPFPAGENAGIETLDPRWGEISSLVQAGSFTDAAKQSEALLSSGVIDTRLIGYLCFGVFLDEGVPKLGRILDALAKTLGERWTQVGPKGSKVKASQSMLAWLFKQIDRRVKREEETKSKEFTRWTQSVTPDDVDAILGSLRGLQGAIDSSLGVAAPPIQELASKLREWLNGFKRVAKVPAPPPPEPVAAAPEPVAAANKPTAAGSAPPAADGASSMLQGSYHFRQLLKKLEAFEQLVAKEKWPRARIVADDINATLANFDPLLFFPTLFTSYLKLMAVHVGSMVEYESARDTPDWKALKALYLADLDQFVAL